MSTTGNCLSYLNPAAAAFEPGSSERILITGKLNDGGTTTETPKKDEILTTASTMNAVSSESDNLQDSHTQTVLPPQSQLQAEAGVSSLKGSRNLQEAKTVSLTQKKTFKENAPDLANTSKNIEQALPPFLPKYGVDMDHKGDPPGFKHRCGNPNFTQGSRFGGSNSATALSAREKSVLTRSTGPPAYGGSNPPLDTPKSSSSFAVDQANDTLSSFLRKPLNPYPYACPTPEIHGTDLFVAALPAQPRCDPSQAPPQVQQRPMWHFDAGKVGALYDSNGVFVKQRKDGCISLIYEQQIRCRGRHGYSFTIFDGIVSASDGVGFVFAERVPCSKNIKRLWSVFANRAGHVVKRMGPHLVRSDHALLPPLAVGQTLSMVLDLNQYAAAFQTKAPNGTVLARSVVDLSDVAERVDCSRGYLCAAVTRAGMVVHLDSAPLSLFEEPPVECVSRRIPPGMYTPQQLPLRNGYHAHAGGPNHHSSYNNRNAHHNIQYGVPQQHHHQMGQESIGVPRYPLGTSPKDSGSLHGKSFEPNENAVKFNKQLLHRGYTDMYNQVANYSHYPMQCNNNSLNSFAQPGLGAATMNHDLSPISIHTADAADVAGKQCLASWCDSTGIDTDPLPLPRTSAIDGAASMGDVASQFCSSDVRNAQTSLGFSRAADPAATLLTALSRDAESSAGAPPNPLEYTTGWEGLLDRTISNRRDSYDNWATSSIPGETPLTLTGGQRTTSAATSGGGNDTALLLRVLERWPEIAAAAAAAGRSNVQGTLSNLSAGVAAAMLLSASNGNGGTENDISNTFPGDEWDLRPLLLSEGNRTVSAPPNTAGSLSTTLPTHFINAADRGNSTDGVSSNAGPKTDDLILP